MDDGIDLEELRRERERQTELLKQLGLLDDEPEQIEASEVEEEEAEEEHRRITLAEFDQVQEQIDRQERQEAKASPSVRLDLFIYTPATSVPHNLKPAPLRLSTGRVLHDYGNRVFAVGSAENAEEVAADLLEAAQRKGWASYTIKASRLYEQVLRAAFRKAIKEGLPLIPDFGPTGQGAIAVSVSKQLRDEGLSDKARDFMRMATGMGKDERQEMRATLSAKLKARAAQGK